MVWLPESINSINWILTTTYMLHNFAIKDYKTLHDILSLIPSENVHPGKKIETQWLGI